MGNRDNNPRPSREAPEDIAFPRRRLGRVEHDHRGNARMEWALLPEDDAANRPVLEILEGDATRQPKAYELKASAYKRGFEPYGRDAAAAPAEAPCKPKDLRKLGEWLKMTRELEERRKRGED